MSAPIIIPAFRASFRELQVGDKFLVTEGRWEARTITRITDRHFIFGFGVVKPSGLHEWQDKYDRHTGDKLGERFKGATLPTPELVAEINADAADRQNRRTLDNTAWRKLTDEQAAQVCALLASFGPTEEAAP